TTATAEEIENTHVAPFKVLIKSVPHEYFAIMMGHLNAPSLQDDGLPASMSQTWMKHLRETIGFRGVVITDSANMTAASGIPGGEPRYVHEALQNGNDLVLEPIDVRDDLQILRLLNIKHGEAT